MYNNINMVEASKIEFMLIGTSKALCAWARPESHASFLADE